MAIVLAFFYPLTHIVFFAGILMEFIVFWHRDAGIMKLYGPLLIAFQVYALFVNHEFFLAEFAGRAGYYSFPAIIAGETVLHCVFMLLYVRLATRIIPEPPGLWRGWIALCAVLAPLVLLALHFMPAAGWTGFMRDPQAVRLGSALSTSAVLLYSAVYFLRYRKAAAEPECARPMMLFAAIGNIAFVLVFVPVQLMKMGGRGLPAFVSLENFYMLAVGLANIFFDAPSAILANREVPTDPEYLVELKAREREILERLGRGMANKQIAADLNLGEATVRNYIHSLFKKYRVSNRVQLMTAIKGPRPVPVHRVGRS